MNRMDSLDGLDNISSLEIIPSEYALDDSKPKGLLTRIGNLFCINKVVKLDNPFPTSLQIMTNFYR